MSTESYTNAELAIKDYLKGKIESLFEDGVNLVNNILGNLIQGVDSPVVTLESDYNDNNKHSLTGQMRSYLSEDGPFTPHDVLIARSFQPATTPAFFIEDSAIVEVLNSENNPFLELNINGLDNLDSFCQTLATLYYSYSYSLLDRMGLHESNFIADALIYERDTHPGDYEEDADVEDIYQQLMEYGAGIFECIVNFADTPNGEHALYYELWSSEGEIEDNLASINDLFKEDDYEGLSDDDNNGVHYDNKEFIVTLMDRSLDDLKYSVTTYILNKVVCVSNLEAIYYGDKPVYRLEEGQTLDPDDEWYASFIWGKSKLKWLDRFGLKVNRPILLCTPRLKSSIPLERTIEYVTSSVAEQVRLKSVLNTIFYEAAPDMTPLFSEEYFPPKQSLKLGSTPSIDIQITLMCLTFEENYTSSKVRISTDSVGVKLVEKIHNKISSSIDTRVEMLIFANSNYAKSKEKVSEIQANLPKIIDHASFYLPNRAHVDISSSNPNFIVDCWTSAFMPDTSLAGLLVNNYSVYKDFGVPLAYQECLKASHKANSELINSEAFAEMSAYRNCYYDYLTFMCKHPLVINNPISVACTIEISEAPSATIGVSKGPILTIGAVCPQADGFIKYVDIDSPADLSAILDSDDDLMKLSESYQPLFLIFPEDFMDTSPARYVLNIGEFKGVVGFEKHKDVIIQSSHKGSIRKLKRSSSFYTSSRLPFELDLPHDNIIYDSYEPNVDMDNIFKMKLGWFLSQAKKAMTRWDGQFSEEHQDQEFEKSILAFLEECAALYLPNPLGDIKKSMTFDLDTFSVTVDMKLSDQETDFARDNLKPYALLGLSKLKIKVALDTQGADIRAMRKALKNNIIENNNGYTLKAQASISLAKNVNLIASAKLALILPQMPLRFEEHCQPNDVINKTPLGVAMDAFCGKSIKSPYEFLSAESYGALYKMLTRQTYFGSKKDNAGAYVNSFRLKDSSVPFIGAARYLYSFLDFYTKPIAVLHNIVLNPQQFGIGRENPLLKNKAAQAATYSIRPVEAWLKVYCEALLQSQVDCREWSLLLKMYEEGNAPSLEDVEYELDLWSAYATIKEFDDLFTPLNTEYEDTEYEDASDYNFKCKLNAFVKTRAYADIEAQLPLGIRNYLGFEDLMNTTLSPIADTLNLQTAFEDNRLEYVKSMRAFVENQRSSKVVDSFGASDYDAFSHKLNLCTLLFARFWTFSIATFYTQEFKDSQFFRDMLKGDGGITHVADLSELFEFGVISPGILKIKNNKSVSIGDGVKKKFTIANLSKNIIPYVPISFALKQFAPTKQPFGNLPSEPATSTTSKERLSLGAYLAIMSLVTSAKQVISLDNIEVDDFGPLVWTTTYFGERLALVQQNGFASDDNSLKLSPPKTESERSQISKRFENVTSNFQLCIGQDAQKYKRVCQDGDGDIFSFFDNNRFLYACIYLKDARLIEIKCAYNAVIGATTTSAGSLSRYSFSRYTAQDIVRRVNINFVQTTFNFLMYLNGKPYRGSTSSPYDITMSSCPDVRAMADGIFPIIERCLTLQKIDKRDYLPKPFVSAFNDALDEVYATQKDEDGNFTFDVNSLLPSPIFSEAKAIFSQPIYADKDFLISQLKQKTALTLLNYADFIYFQSLMPSDLETQTTSEIDMLVDILMKNPTFNLNRLMDAQPFEDQKANATTSQSVYTDSDTKVYDII